MAAGTRARATIDNVELDFSGLFSSAKKTETTQTGAVAEAPEPLTVKPVAQPERNTPPPISDSMKRYKAIFRDVFNFLERNSPPSQSEEYWEKACNDYIETGRKYAGDEFACKLFVDAFEELENEYKKQN